MYCRMSILLLNDVLISKQDIDECENNPEPCHNGASCVNQIGGYQCACVAGSTGEHCETGKYYHRPLYELIP